MPEDRVTITADAGQYFDVLSRAGVAADRLSGSGARVGEGFVRGERVIRTASANIAQSLIMSGDAATTALVAMQGLERVFRIGVLPTVAVAAGIALFEVLHKQIQRTTEASNELGKELGQSLGLQVQGSVESIGLSIDALTAKIAKLRKEANSPTSGFIKALLGREDTEAASLRRAEHGGPDQLPQTKEQKQLIDGEQRLKDLATARADKELKIAEAKRDQNTIGKLELDYEDQRAKLFQGAFKAGLNMVDLMKRLIALQINLNSEIGKEVQKRHDAVAAAAQKFKKTVGDLFGDIGSGQFLRDQDARNLRNQQIQRGKDIFNELNDAANRGIPLNQGAADIVNAGRAAAGKGFQSIEDVQRMDFSNLDVLSKYDFSGLAPLSGITITIQ